MSVYVYTYEILIVTKDRLYAKIILVIIMNGLFVREISISNNIPSGNYINNLPVVNWLKSNSLEFNKPVTFIVGENGIGKSTLIEGLAVALGFNPEGGKQEIQLLNRKLSL